MNNNCRKLLYKTGVKPTAQIRKKKPQTEIITQPCQSFVFANTFLKTKSGYKVTNPEGFVAIDHAEGGAVKLVDRLEFSTNNFDPNIIKGWENPN